MPDIMKMREDFQDLILASMIKYPSEFMYVTAAMQPKYFSGVLPTLCARAMFDHAKKYNRFPTWEVLQQCLEDETSRMPDAEITGVQDYVNKLKGLDVSDWVCVRDKIAGWLRERALINTVVKAVGMLKEDKIPPDGYSSMFLEAMQVGQNLDDLGYLLNTDVDKILAKVMDVDYGLPTGFPLLDTIWKRGWGPGWLVVPAAPPKTFKTTLALNLALNVASPIIGQNVFYYACEINAEQAAVRAMCNLAGLGEDYLYEDSEKFTEAVKKAMGAKLKGQLLFKSFASKRATIADIRAHAHIAASQLGIKPRLIIIDYAETIQPREQGRDREPEYRQQSGIYVDARALACEFGATVVMPDRVNRETVNLEVPSITALQGAFEKAGVVDVAFGLCATPEEQQNNTIRLFNFINRHGPAGQHLRGHVDPETWRIQFLEQIPHQPKKTQQQMLRRPRGRQPLETMY